MTGRLTQVQKFQQFIPKRKKVVVELKPNVQKPVGGEVNCRSTEEVPMPPNAGTLLFVIGLPISPGTMLPLWPEAALIVSDSNLTNCPFSSSRIENEPPPFCGLPSVSQMSSISFKEIAGSLDGFNCSIWRRTRCTSWQPLASLEGRMVLSCLQACITSNRIVTGRDVCVRWKPPVPKALFDQPLPTYIVNIDQGR